MRLELGLVAAFVPELLGVVSDYGAVNVHTGSYSSNKGVHHQTRKHNMSQNDPLPKTGPGPAAI
jgi:hypothetical protein